MRPAWPSRSLPKRAAPRATARSGSAFSSSIGRAPSCQAAIWSRWRKTAACSEPPLNTRPRRPDGCRPGTRCGVRAEDQRCALGHPVLHLDRAANGIDHATKLDDAPIAGALHYAPVVLAMVGSIRSLQRARRRASVRSSSEPASLLYPATSAARMAASFRVSAMAVPSPHARLARLLIGLYRLWVQHLIQHLLGVGLTARS